MFWVINDEVASLVTDEVISDALSEGGRELRAGIMKRCIDYDRNYRLKSLGFNKHQRAVGAMYIYSKEVKSPIYENLERAVRDYASRVGASSIFPHIDERLVWKGGNLYWNP